MVYRSFFKDKNVLQLQYLVLPFGLPPFDLSNIKFWILIVCFLFYLFVFLDLFFFWWFKLLPRENIKRLQQNKQFIVTFLYSIRVTGFRFVKQFNDKYGDDIFDVIWFICVCVLIGFPYLVWALMVYLYRYITNTERYVRVFVKWYNFFYFYYIKISIFIRPYFAILFSKYGIIFEIPALICNSSLGQTMILTVKLYIYLVPTFVLVACFGFIFMIVWYFSYKMVNCIITTSLIKLFKLTFPQLSISNLPQKINSASEFYHTKQSVIPAFIKLRTLVGLRSINVWASLKLSKTAIVNKHTSARPIRMPRKSRFSSLTHFYTNKVIVRDPLQHRYIKIIDRSFNLQHNTTNTYKIHGSSFKRQLILPLIIDSKLNYNSILLKSILLHKNYCSRLVDYRRLFTILLKSLDNPIINLKMDCNKYYFKVPHASNFFKQNFYNYKDIQNLILSSAKTSFFKANDQRFVPAKVFFRYKRFLKPTRLTLSNLVLRVSNLTELLKLFNLNSFFCKKNQINIRFLQKNSSYRVFKSRRSLVFFGAKLKFFLQKKGKLNINFKQFENCFIPDTKFYKSLMFSDRNQIALRKTFLIFKRINIGYLRARGTKKYFNSTRFSRLFFFVLVKRRLFNFLIKNIFFLRLVNTYNLKILSRIKFNKACCSNKSHVPLTLTLNYPWWFVYARLLTQDLFKLQSLMYHKSFNYYLHEETNFLSNLALNYRLITKVFSKRIGGTMRSVRGLNNCFLNKYRRRLLEFFCLRLHRFKRQNRRLRKIKKLYKIIFRRNSFNIRFFFDLLFYNKIQAVNGFLKINNNSNLSGYEYFNKKIYRYTVFVISLSVASFYLFFLNQ